MEGILSNRGGYSHPSYATPWQEFEQRRPQVAGILAGIGQRITDPMSALPQAFSETVGIPLYDPARTRAAALGQQLPLTQQRPTIGFGLGGIIKDIPSPKWLQGRNSIPVGIDPTKSELKELFREQDDLRVLVPTRDGLKHYLWPADYALHQDVGSYFRLNPSDYEHGIFTKSDFNR